MTTRRKRRQPSGKVRSEPEHRVDHLIVVRESDQHDRLLMAGMIAQTLHKASGLPGVDEMVEAGMDVFDNPKRYGAEKTRLGKSTMCVLERDGVVFFYSMASASKDDLDDANAFVTELARAIEKYAPHEIWVAAFTRLLRSTSHQSDLYRALSRRPTKLHCELEIDFAELGAAMSFDVLALVAAGERDNIVSRLTIGRVAQWRRKEWIPKGYPPGYKVDERNQLVVDEGKVESTRAMLTVLADAALTTREKAERIAALGVTTPKLQQLYGPQATIGDAGNPHEVVETLYGWVGTYETGIYEMLWGVPMRGLKEVLGVPVEQHPGYANGALRMPYTLPLPDGGWGTTETFDALRRRQPSLIWGTGHALAPPMAGLFQFDVDDTAYRLLGGKRQRGTYELARRPRTSGPASAGWRSERHSSDIEIIAVVRRSEWHQSMADGIEGALRDGVSAELEPFRFQLSDGLPTVDENRQRIRQLQRDLSEARRVLRNALRNAELTDDDDLARTLLADAAQHRRNEENLVQQIADLEAVLEDPQLEPTFSSNAELLAHAVAALANAPDSVPAHVSEALRTVITAERCWIDGNSVHWELSVEVPHAHGTVIIGPITGAVPNRKRPPTKPKPPHQTTEVRRRLEGYGLSRNAVNCLMACPHPLLVETFCAAIEGQPLPEDVDPEWARLIVATYTSADLQWTPGRWRLDDDLRRRVIEAIAKRGGTASRQELIDEGLDSDQVRYLSRTLSTPTGTAILRPEPRRGNPLYHLHPCPHCGGVADHSCLSPETRAGVLCSQCWRTPDDNSPVYPAIYRT
jgi:DNA invertase Pin-like site-specific DNA recombinase